MKAPARVLSVATGIFVVVALFICYKYGLIGGSTSQKNSTPPMVSVTQNPPEPPSPPTTPPPKTVAVATPDELAHGKQLYAEKTCALCHGATGKADTATGQALHSTDLTSGKFHNNKNNLPATAYILQVIENGVPGTGMASFKNQIPNEKDRKDLAQYVNSLSK